MFTSLGNSISRSGLVGEWLLDGNALDTSGNGYNLTATNVTYVKTTKGYQSQCGTFSDASSSRLLGTIGAYTNVSYSVWLRIDDISNTNQCIMGTWNTGALYISYNHITANQLTIGNYNGSSDRKIDCGNLTQGQWYHIVMTRDASGNGIVYKDGKQINSGLLWNISTSTSFAISGSNPINTGYYHNGAAELARIYNRVLTQEEIQLLYLEGQKLLGPTNIAKYPKLFEGLVGYFENPTGTTELWNIANGVNSTRVAGSNTTDNLGNNRALSNPNYTWTSITYTTGYTFENSGSGWSIVTNPLGLLGTGINRVTTLRNVFLFTRTLSSDEVTLLQNLCNSNYIYPNPSYDLPNLRDGLVLDLNEQGKDLSGNGNHGTLVNAPTVIRQGKSKGLSYNGSNQYIDLPENSSFNFTTEGTISAVIKTTAVSHMVMTNYSQVGTGIPIVGYQCYIDANGKTQFNFGTGGNYNPGVTWFGVIGNTAINDGKIHILTWKKTSSNIQVYVDGNLDGTLNTTATIGYSSNIRNNVGVNEAQPGTISNFFNGVIINLRVWNRALSNREIQQLYYSLKGNYIY